MECTNLQEGGRKLNWQKKLRGAPSYISTTLKDKSLCIKNSPDDPNIRRKEVIFCSIQATPNVISWTCAPQYPGVSEKWPFTLWPWVMSHATYYHRHFKSVSPENLTNCGRGVGKNNPKYCLQQSCNVRNVTSVTIYVTSVTLVSLFLIVKISKFFFNKLGLCKFAENMRYPESQSIIFFCS